MDNNIQFDEPEYTRPTAYQGSKPGFAGQERAHPEGLSNVKGLSGLVIKWKLAKDEEGVRRVLLIVIAICVIVMIFMWWSQAGNNYILYKLPVVPPQPPAP